MKTFDLAVVGAGPGGYLAAILAAQRGLSVVAIEKEKLGGVCLNWGCIPTKALLRAAEQYRWIRDEAEKFGILVGEVRHDFAKVVGRSRRIADQSERGVKFLFKKYGVNSVAGTATLLAPGQLRVGDEEIQAKHVILATGARPKTFPGLEPDGERILSYREAIVRDTQPKSAIILGSGAIGLEFAWFWASFGSEVTVVEALPRIAPLEDEEVSAELAKSFKKQGIGLRTGVLCQRVERTESGVRARMADGSVIEAELALLALGVSPNVEGLGLEGLGVALEKGAIAVDPSYRTNVPGLYAIGDVAGPPALAHAAYAEAHVCVARIVGEHVPDVDYDCMPAATYCQPQVGSVGLTEAAARAKGLSYKVGKFPFSANGKARASGFSEGFAKVLIGARGEILGAHLVGHDVAELLANYVMAKSAEVTAEHFLHTVHAHPTLGEAMLESVAEALGKGAHL